jgi:hypothetical protein
MGMNQIVKKPSSTEIPVYISFPDCKDLLMDSKELLEYLLF